MSAALNLENEWNYRTSAKRLVTVKTKSPTARKVAVLDVVTNLLLTVQVSENVNLQDLAANHEYLFNLKIYTSRDIAGVNEDFVSFFEALDIDQSIEDFIKAYWVYPGKIRFELTEVEEA